MRKASELETCPLIPGRKYLLYVSNKFGADAVNPFQAFAFPGLSSEAESIYPENSETAFSVSANKSRWIIFYAVWPNFYINSSSADVIWRCDAID